MQQMGLGKDLNTRPNLLRKLRHKLHDTELVSDLDMSPKAQATTTKKTALIKKIFKFVHQKSTVSPGWCSSVD